ncbi:damage-control phosphatase ARMT1-like isoform X2 [Leguminivora glycinivorella]|uniref:damage-control phosphatase ARMT1-like isoform X2 n=1 Tax=Leguminivora glycinivorella TaxID=1035111 RepID=UPI0020105D21|nr:damage-control phosphatase ARMT1-like isoform X2 [Leguminivora glycinivorella]
MSENKTSTTSLKSPDKSSVKSQSVKSPDKSSLKTIERSSQQSVHSRAPYVDRYYESCQEPDFIYGGPFIPVKRPEPFIDAVTPINLELQGTFKQSFAYYSMKERIPVILTKVIDNLSKKGDGDSKALIEYVARLKNEVVTNKKYSKFLVGTPEADQWNEWLDSRQANTYFTDVWVFAECYVYRRLREGVELIPSLKDFDPFGEQKKQAFMDGLEAMCMTATQLTPMLSPSDKDKRKQDFMNLLKICLWSNKCDLSLSVGEPVTLGEKGKDPAQQPAIDPFQMVIDFKDKLLADDTAKIADQVVAKAEAIGKAIANEQKEALARAAADKANKGKGKGKAPPPPPPPPPEPAEDGAEPEPPPPPVPCPAKVLVPSAVQFDIVCDNAGFELFADLCLATWLVEQKIVTKIRFYVKKIPWFISDVTPKDFTELITMCCNAEYSRQAPAPEPKKPLAEGEAPPPPTSVTSAELKALGKKFQRYYEDGVFVVSCEDFWTSPHVFKDMKKYDYWLYRKLQYAVAVLFKGDLNYRKLLGEKNVPPITPLLQALQGFQPAPLIACRTVKCDLICGLKKGRAEQLFKIDPKWMQTGDYGVIQFCPKAEPLKVADRPCKYYCAECLGLACPDEEPFW